MKKRIQVKQHDRTDCGAACLASIASQWLKLKVVTQFLLGYYLQE